MTAPVGTTEAGVENAQAAADAAAAAATATGAETQTGTGGESTRVVNEHGFPDATPLSGMDLKEQAAYWKFQSRKHESAAKAAPDSGRVAELEAEIAKLTSASQTAEQAAAAKAAQDAATEAREAARKELLPMLHESQVRGYASTVIKDGAKLEAFVRNANIGAFIAEDGQNIDGEKLVAELSLLFGPADTAPTTPPNGNTHMNFGQVATGPVGAKKTDRGAAGREAAIKRGFIKAD